MPYSIIVMTMILSSSWEAIISLTAFEKVHNIFNSHHTRSNNIIEDIIIQNNNNIISIKIIFSM